VKSSTLSVKRNHLRGVVAAGATDKPIQLGRAQSTAAGSLSTPVTAPLRIGVTGSILYDHFGDFAALILETQYGDRNRFDSHEAHADSSGQRLALTHHDERSYHGTTTRSAATCRVSSG
jgi:hypothetical protein